MLVVKPVLTAAEDESAGADGSRQWTGTEEAIIAVLKEADKPLKAAAIAVRAGYEFTDYFRRLVYRLVKANIIRQVDGRYYELAPTAPPSSLELRETTATHDAILLVLAEAEKPLKRGAIARRAQAKNNSHFFTRLRELCKAGRVIPCDGYTYWLAERPMPSAAA